MSILQYGFMQRAFLVGILLAVITPCIGITIVLKRMSMIGDALSHSSLAGVVLGLILGINPVAGAVVMCIVAALGIEAIRKKNPAVFGGGDLDRYVCRDRTGRCFVRIRGKRCQSEQLLIRKYCVYQ